MQWNRQSRTFRQVYRSEEMAGKAGLFDLRDACHSRGKTKIEHSNGLNSHESIHIERFNARALIRWLRRNKHF